MDLCEYFQPDGQRRALDTFSSFAESAGRSGWPIRERFDMYQGFAFLAEDSRDGHKLFEEAVYGVLKSSWQVFRPHDAIQCWDAGRILETVRGEFVNFGWHTPVTLLTLTAEQNRVLLSKLPVMATIKPNRGFPIMTVSKFLHFFNPALFPVYDEAVIWNLVLAKRFNNEFRAFHSEFSLRYGLGDTANWLAAYIGFANWMVSAADPQFMKIFASWLNAQPGCGGVDEHLISCRLYAMAFEYTIIGAAVAEQGTKPG